MKYIFPSLVVLGLLAGCSNSKTAEPAETTSVPPPAVQPVVAPVNPPAAPSTAMALPSFNMLNARNQVIDLRQFAGKKVFVNLWATWCPPCRAEIPSIESLAAKTDKSKVEFVMLSLDDNFAKATAYATKNNMKQPVYYPAGNLPPLFTVDGIPVTFIFNEKGEIIFQQVGTANYDTPAFLDMLNK
jgi:thiol-disulfide isomerase/thioredoxin